MSLYKKMLAACSIVLLFHSMSFIEALIVPQELPTILSLIYSNIPVLKKGTDSRLGFGFRLGEHADFQVLLELGPQKETRPIGNQDSDNSFNKRQVSKKEKNAILKELWRQQLKQQYENIEQPASYSTSTERNAANWLQNWSQDMQGANVPQKPNKSKNNSIVKKNSEKLNSMPPAAAPPMVAQQSLKQLQLLYKLATTTTPSEATAESSRKEDLILLPQQLVARLHQSRSLKAPDLQNLPEKEEKSKSEITKELMDVSLE